MVPVSQFESSVTKSFDSAKGVYQEALDMKSHSGEQVNSLSSCFPVKECHMKEGCSHASINTVIRNELLEAQMFAID